MAGPWEQFAPQSSEAAGPWTKFAPPPADNLPATTTEFGSPGTQPATTDAPGNAAIERISNAAGEAYRNTQPLVTPQAEEAINHYSGMVGSQLINPALKIIGGAVASGKAGIAAVSQAAMETFGEKGGRDFLAALSSLPMAAGERMSPEPAAAPAEATPPPRFMNELTALPDTIGLTPLHRAMDLIRHDEATQTPRGPDAGMANQSLIEPPQAVLQAGNVDTAIGAAQKAIGEPAPLPEVPAEPVPTQSMAEYKAAANPSEPLPTEMEITRAVTSGNIPATSRAAKNIAGAYYAQADQAGGVLTPKFTNDFIDTAAKIAPQTEAGRAVAGDTAITGLVERMEALRDQPISLQAAQEIDESLGNLIDKEYGLKGLTKEGKSILDLQSTFRDMIRNAGPDDVVGGTEGFDALNTARQAWSQAMKMDDLERIQARADLTDNPATSIRTGIRTLLNSTRSRGYSADEIAALKDAANRGVLGGVLHVFGSRLIPIGAGAAGFYGGPVSAAIHAGVAYGGTALARAGATALQSSRLNNAMNIIGSKVPPMPQGAP